MARKDDKIEELIKSGEEKATAGDFKGAIADLDKAINLKPADKSQLAEAYNDRGFAKNELGRREEAIADYNEAMRLCNEAIDFDSENARAWYNRGAAKNELSRYEEAIADLDEAIRLDPEFASAWNNRGFAKNEFGRHEEAIADLDEAIRLDPKLAAAWSNRGSAKDNLGRHEEAIADFDEVIRLKPKNKNILSSTYNNRGLAKNSLGHHEEAIKDFDQAIRLDPQLATAWNNRGSSNSEFGRHEEAIADFDEAIRLAPEDAIALNNRAAIKAEQAAREAVEKRLGSFKADTEKVKWHAEKYERREKRNRIFAYILMFVLAGAILYLVAILIAPNLRPDFLPELEFIYIETPYNLLPFITLIIIIISPLVWTIRLLLVSANKAELMQAEYMHLALVEGRMLVYFQEHDTDEGRRIRADYIKITMINSPADKLLAFQNKACVPSSNPVQDIVEKTVSKVSDKSSR